MLSNIKVICFMLPFIIILNEANARDPFMPGRSTPSKPIVAGDTEERAALANQAISGLDLVGIITAKKDSIAILQTRDNRRIMVREGDKIGRESAIVEDIDISGINVKVGEDITHIEVHHELEVIDE